MDNSLIEINKVPIKKQLDDYIKNGNLLMVKCLINSGVKFENYSVYYAVKTENFEMVTYIMESGITDYALSHAFDTQNLKMINHVIELGAKDDYRDVFLRAIATENLEIIKYAVEKINLFICRYSSLNEAIKTKNLEIVKYVIKLNVEVDYYSLLYAIETNNLEIVKCIIEWGITCDKKLLKRSLGNLKIAQYLINSMLDC